MGKGKSFICGFITGGLAAGLTVLLSTPKSGTEFRHELKDKWDDANINLLDMKTAAESVKDSVSDFTKKSIPTLQTTAKELKTILNTWKDDIQPNIKRISHSLKELDKQSKKTS